MPSSYRVPQAFGGYIILYHEPLLGNLKTYALMKRGIGNFVNSALRSKGVIEIWGKIALIEGEFGNFGESATIRGIFRNLGKSAPIEGALGILSKQPSIVEVFDLNKLIPTVVVWCWEWYDKTNTLSSSERMEEIFLH